jgi:HEPN domain-containing protein
MDYYKLAESHLSDAQFLFSGNRYRSAVYYACLAFETYLKSTYAIIHTVSEGRRDHDVLGLFREVS